MPGGAEQEEHDETQDHIEVCRGYANLWDGLGPNTMKSRRCRYFMRVKAKKLKQQQEDKQRNKLEQQQQQQDKLQQQ